MNRLYLACKIQFIDSIERGYGTSGLRLTELWLFIFFIVRYAVHLYMNKDRVICGFSRVMPVSVAAFYPNHAQFMPCLGQIVNRAE